MSATPPTETAPTARPKRKRPRWPLWLAVGFAVLLVLLVLVLQGLYMARRSLGRDAVIGWLRERGVEAEIEVERLDLDGFDGKIRIGPANDPEVTVDRAEVRYRLTGPWMGRAFGAEVGEVRLIRPVARASFQRGKFSMGSLDRVLDEFRQAPPRPDAKQPKITVEDGRFVLTTDYGRADLRGGAVLEDGKLMQAAFGLQPTTLRAGALQAAIKGGRLEAVTRGARVALVLQAEADSLAYETIKAQGLSIDLKGEMPYPDLKAQRGDGRVLLDIHTAAVEASLAETSVNDARLALRFDGEAKGWIDTLNVSGTTEATLNAAGFRTGELALTDAVVAGAGPTAFDIKDGPDLRLAATARARGAWPIMGPPAKTDDATIGGFKRLLGRFTVAAPGLDMAVGKSLAVSLTQPVRIDGAGGQAIVTSRSGGPLFDGQGGALNLAVRGAELPVIAASVPRWDLTPTGMAARTDLSFKGSLGPLMGADFKTSGRLTLAGENVSYTTTICIPATLERIELGVNDVDTVAGTLCPTRDPLLTLAGGGWRLRARAEKASVNAPFLEARVVDGAGVLDVGGKGETFKADATITAARALDTAPETRFNPLRLTGTAASRNGDVTGDFVVSDEGGHKLADAHLTQTASGKGGVTFDTGDLVLAEGGVQPAELSPLAAMIVSPATGRVRFTGQMGWEGETTTSSGVAVLEDIGFRSAAGPISGLAGRLEFTSLAPVITTAPGQTLTVRQVSAFVPLTEAKATFELQAQALKLAGAQVTAAGGTLSLEPLSIPLPPPRVPGAPPAPPAPLPTFEGTLQVRGIQLSDLVKASPFADRADIDAKVSGTVPFILTPEGVRIIEGKLGATQPGRISIRREVLTEVKAEGGETTATSPELPVAAPPVVAAPPPNTIADIAYQAMEDLAFDKLDVTLNSLPGGRLGGLFHISGRHDPPKKVELRLGVIDLVTRKFLQKELPLPSGTPVNLTLDTSLNLDEVWRDVIASRTSSAGVQP